MNKTLAENGIVDEDNILYELKMNREDHLPVVEIYFNDDLTEA